MQLTDEGLKREIGVWGLSANMINIMVGAGIFVLPALVAQTLGAASVLGYLFNGFMVALVMLCFAEVGSKITESGGAYTYIERAFGRYPGFLTTNLFVLSSMAADAAMANALVNIIELFVPAFQIFAVKAIFLLMVFSGFAYVNVIGVKEGIGLVKTVTIIKLMPLFLLGFLGWPGITLSNLAWEGIPSIGSIGKTSLILFFAFQGCESGLNVGGEVKNPHRTIPKAIFISVAVVLGLYLLMQIIAQGVLGDTLPDYKESPLAEVAGQLLGPIGFTFITICAALSIFGALSSEILSLPRLLYQSARDGVIIPNALGKIHKQFGTPWISIITYATVGYVFSMLGGFRFLAIMSSAAMLLIYLGVAMAVIKLRRMDKVKASSFRIPGGATVPILASLAIVWLLSSLAREEMMLVGISIGGLTLLYSVMRFVQKRSGS